MIFVSISDTDIEKCVVLIEKYKHVELRLDLIKPDIDELPLLISKAETSICTYRTDTDPKTSLGFLKNSLEFGADIVDFSMTKPQEYIFELSDTAADYSKKFMLSYHNYEFTPEKKLLEKLINEAGAYNPDLIKIACLCDDEKDSDLLLSLTEINEKIIPVPMGEAGVRGRLKSYFHGSPLVYACPDGEKPTAPGQPAYADYKDIDRIIGLIYGKNKIK